MREQFMKCAWNLCKGENMEENLSKLLDGFMRSLSNIVQCLFVWLRTRTELCQRAPSSSFVCIVKGFELTFSGGERSSINKQRLFI